MQYLTIQKGDVSRGPVEPPAGVMPRVTAVAPLRAQVSPKHLAVCREVRGTPSRRTVETMAVTIWLARGIRISVGRRRSADPASADVGLETKTARKKTLLRPVARLPPPAAYVSGVVAGSPRCLPPWKRVHNQTGSKSRHVGPPRGSSPRSRVSSKDFGPHGNTAPRSRAPVVARAAVAMLVWL